MDDFEKRALQETAKPLLDRYEEFLRQHTKNVDEVENLEKAIVEEMRYRAAVVENDYVMPREGWDLFGRC